MGGEREDTYWYLVEMGLVGFHLPCMHGPYFNLIQVVHNHLDDVVSLTPSVWRLWFDALNLMPWAPRTVRYHGSLGGRTWMLQYLPYLDLFAQSWHKQSGAPRPRLCTVHMPPVLFIGRHPAAGERVVSAFKNPHFPT